GHLGGPLYYYGGEIENLWNTRGSDFTGSEYWPAFPAELAEQDVQVPGPADSAQVPLSRYGHVIGDGAAHRDQGGESFVRLDPARGDATVAVRRGGWADRTGRGRSSPSGGRRASRPRGPRQEDQSSAPPRRCH